MRLSLSKKTEIAQAQTRELFDKEIEKAKDRLLKRLRKRALMTLPKELSNPCAKIKKLIEGNYFNTSRLIPDATLEEGLSEYKSMRGNYSYYKIKQGIRFKEPVIVPQEGTRKTYTLNKETKKAFLNYATLFADSEQYKKDLLSVLDRYKTKKQLLEDYPDFKKYFKPLATEQVPEIDKVKERMKKLAATVTKKNK